MDSITLSNPLSKADGLEAMSLSFASLKDAGRLTFGVSKMGDSVIPGLLANLRNATSVRKEYAK